MEEHRRLPSSASVCETSKLVLIHDVWRSNWNWLAYSRNQTSEMQILQRRHDDCNKQSMYNIEVRFLTVNKNVIKKVVEIWRINIFPPSFWIFNKMTIKLWFLLPMKMMIPFKFPFSHQMWQIKRSHNKASREKYSGQDFDSHKYRVGKIGLSSCTYWRRNGSTKSRQCRKRILSHRRSNKKQN